MESAIIGTVVIVGFIALVGFAIYRQKKFEGVRSSLEAQIEALKSRYNDLKK